jgi:D-methionine transport system ATP-binding protein
VETPKLSIENVTLTRSLTAGRGGPEEREVLKGVSFHVREGEVFGIIGPSGAGKTSVLRLLDGLESPDAGRILLDGRNVADMDVVQLRRRVGMVFQAPALFSTDVAGNVEFALDLLGVSRSEREARALTCLDLVGLPGEFRWRKSTELSQGERQRVAIARALAAGPEVLVLDEPTSALDPAASARILTLVESLNERLGVTIVFVTHLLAQARKVCDRALVLVGGRGIEKGETERLFDAPASPLTRLFTEGKLVGSGSGSGESGGGAASQTSSTEPEVGAA